ncbi:MAG TPA: mannose-1-phosphate guanylyltransferase [bacterium]
MYGVILAGGSGTRFWPLSRSKTPKQFLKFGSKRTMIEETVARLSPVIPIEKIIIVTTEEHRKKIRKILKDIPGENIIIEPAGRNTAPAITLAALRLKSQSQEVMAVLPSDHVIMNADKFCRVLTFLENIGKCADSLLTIGIEPARPETGYGYIESGRVFQKDSQFTAYRVKRFIEKPDRKKAESFLRKGYYYWNSGMFVWKIAAFVNAMKKYLPDVYSKAKEAVSCGSKEKIIVDPGIYKEIPSISVDYGIMEKAKNTVVVPVDLGWTDVGSWSSVGDILLKDKNGNVAISNDSLLMDVKNSIFFAKGKFVAGIGIKDLVVVDSNDAILICKKDMSQKVRDLVNMLKSGKKEKYL